MSEQTLMISRKYMTRCILFYLFFAILFGVLAAIPWNMGSKLVSTMRTFCWFEVVIGLIGVVVSLFYIMQTETCLHVNIRWFHRLAIPIK